jgi:hypothetical protein
MPVCLTASQAVLRKRATQFDTFHPQSTQLRTRASLRRRATACIALEISATNAADHLRNFSVIHQNLVKQAECDPFYPELESYLKDFAGFRMMDWTLTNGSEQVNWSDHVPAYGYRQANRFETALQLCNRVQRDCWLNVPHQATDDYVRQLAALVRDTLDPTLKAYIEYSNETWNGQFPQTQYVIEQGVAHNLPGETPYSQGSRFHAFRAKQIFAIFDSAFGSSARSRLVRVLAGQTGSSWLVGEHIDSMPTPRRRTSDRAPWMALAVRPTAGAWTISSRSSATMHCRVPSRT